MHQRKLRALAYVRRFNFERCNRYESVAEHSLFVALLAHEAATLLGWEPSGAAGVAVAAMMHDAAEAATGDIPYLVRAQMDPVDLEELELKAYSELGMGDGPVCTPDQRDVVDYCDALELAMYLRDEMESGNRSCEVVSIYRETLDRLTSSPLYVRLFRWTADLLGYEEPAGGPFTGLKH